MLKKIVACISSVCVGLFCLPLEPLVPILQHVLEITASAEETSGTCGENLTWFFDETTETLTISGTGAMRWDNASSNSSPWYSIRQKINTVIIESGVTSIEKYAFSNCINLTSIIIKCPLCQDTK